MWHLQSTEEFKRKFPEVAAEAASPDAGADAGEGRSWSVRLKPWSQE
jgi:hypothetical protein